MRTTGEEDKECLGDLDVDAVDSHPVFVLGLHRSGTSVLLNTLAATGCFNPVTAYHLIHYEELLQNRRSGREEEARKALTKMLRENGLEGRGIDRLQPTADFAEEYGFLLARTASQMCLTEGNLPVLMELCRKVHFLSGNGKPILLKNPHDFANFLYIKQAIPRAKFVFIHRHPFRTLSSSVKAVRLLVNSRNPYVAQLHDAYGKLFRNPLLRHTLRLCFSGIPVFGVIWLTLSSSRAARYYLGNIERLPSGDYVSLTYEQLCAEPEASIKRVTEAMDLDVENVAAVSSWVQPRQAPLDPTVRRLRRWIHWSMREYFSAFGYRPEADT